MKDTGKRIASQSKGPSKSSKGSKHSTPSHSHGGKSRGWPKQSLASAASTGGNTSSVPPRCSICRKRHSGECRRGAGACFRCGSKDHFVRDCPEEGPAPSVAQTRHSAPVGTRGRGTGRGNVSGRGQGSSAPSVRPDTRVAARVYAIKAREEAETADVIAGTVNLCGTSLFALIDLGSTHSYICQRLAYVLENLARKSSSVFMSQVHWGIV